MVDLKGKFALVAGGAQGIGYACIREFLNNGIEGVTLIDFDAKKGQEAAKVLNQDFGNGKVIFLEADVSKEVQFKDAFKTSMMHWKSLDIVVNNAGIVQDNNWEATLLTNNGGVLLGTLLGFEYMSKNNNGHGGVIINTASITGLIPSITLPIYSATKSFIITLGRSLGNPIYFEHNAVKVLTLCPGKTTTQILLLDEKQFLTHLCPNVKTISDKLLEESPDQTPEELAKNLMVILKEGSNGSVWYISSNKAKEIDFSSIDRQCNP